MKLTTKIKKDVEFMVLSLASEDYIELYEILWRLNTIFPHETIWKKYLYVENALRSLITRNLITIYKTFLNDNVKEYSIINKERIDFILSDPACWYPQGNDNSYVIATTEQGDSTYNSLYNEYRGNIFS